MENEKILQLDTDHVLHTYGRYPVSVVSGKGAVAAGADGREYVDFTSGIGVNIFGYSDDEWVSSVYDQLKKVQHISNYFASPVTSALAAELTRLSGMDKVFFGNSGAEANEGAIKTARKYSFDKYGEGRSTIVTLKDSFHGRTVTTLAATGQDSFHQFFFPFTEGFKYAVMNDFDSFKSAVTPDVCAVMCELIQGEGGVNVADKDYIQAVAEYCDKNDILLILDEVQTGIGRTGTMFAYEQYGISPDIVTLAKGLGGGLPIGAFLCNKKTAGVLGKGQHGTTFGSNPAVCAGALNVLNRAAKPGFLESVREKGGYIRSKLAALGSANIIEVRGAGMMIGIQVKGDPKAYALAALEKGLFVLTAGTDVVRLLPPLNISFEEIDRGIGILSEILK